MFKPSVFEHSLLGTNLNVPVQYLQSFGAECQGVRSKQ